MGIHKNPTLTKGKACNYCEFVLELVILLRFWNDQTFTFDEILTSNFRQQVVSEIVLTVGFSVVISVL